MKLFTKFSAAALGLTLLFAMTPGTAMAGGSVHIDIPGLSLGVHDGHRSKYRHKKRYHKRHYNDYYDNDYRSRRYERRRDRERYYNSYNDDYYYSGRRNSRSYNYSRPRRVEVCPRAGYSRYYLRDSECSSHKGHFHCTIY